MLVNGLKHDVAFKINEITIPPFIFSIRVKIGMKTIEIDDQLYMYIASQTQHIGENASSILRRLLAVKLEAKPIKIADNVNCCKTNLEDFSLIYKLIKGDNFKQENKSVVRFLSILSLLYHWDSPRFSVAATLSYGSKRRYLATSESVLDEYGKNTQPKAITGTPYWVITNNNTARKCHIIESIMNNMIFPRYVIEDVIQHFVAKYEVL